MNMGIPAGQVDTSTPLQSAGEVSEAFGVAPASLHGESAAARHNKALLQNGKRPKDALPPERR